MDWVAFGTLEFASAPPYLASLQQNCLLTIVGARAYGKGMGPGVSKARPETPFLPLSYLGQVVSSFGLSF